MDALTTLNHLHNFRDIYEGEQEQSVTKDFTRPAQLEEDIVQFVACGKKEKLDADMNYSLSQSTFAKRREGGQGGKNEEEVKQNGEEGAKKEKAPGMVGSKRNYEYLEPVQGPINAPYKQFIEKRNDLNNKQ
uniref:Uncharacterized protein n=1 Tax=Strombidium rassoulzadegani TaxID=1082188 RepID=A0A7S3CK35_9SPIT|mmetsp:Transcript_14045/g.23860  ORF Transcript_14045/g.23860 Transcript_14045/m.23860 type:complete len:132 (+) Transcript_14045:677-1072(+)